MRPLFRKLLLDQRGATAIEYGLIVALIVVAMLAGLQQVSRGNGGLWGNFTGRINSVEGGIS